MRMFIISNDNEIKWKNCVSSYHKDIRYILNSLVQRKSKKYIFHHYLIS